MTTYTGTDGDDSLVGGDSDDVFELGQGGNDTAIGGAGDDTFLVGASLDAGDHIDGGLGWADSVVLDGDYSGGLRFVKGMLTHIETLTLTAGHDYRLSGIAALGGAFIDGSGLAATDSLVIEAKHSNAWLNVTAGAGDDIIGASWGRDYLDLSAGGHDFVDAGDGDDTLVLGGALDSGDSLDGGQGYDVIHLTGEPDGGIDMSSGPLRNFEDLRLEGDNDFHISDFAGLDGPVLIYGRNLDGALYADASDARHAVSLMGGQGVDSLVGSKWNDSLSGGFGHDTLIAGAGDDLIELGENDVVFMGKGDDRVAPIYGTGSGYQNEFHGGAGIDTLAVGGDVKFGKHELHSIERVELSGYEQRLKFNDGNIAAGATLTVLKMDRALRTSHVDGSRETDGFLYIDANHTSYGNDFRGGALGDTLVGGDNWDTLIGNGGDDHLDGTFGADVIVGGDGNDVIEKFFSTSIYNASTLDGGLGADTIRASGSSDRIVYETLFDSTVAAPDLIQSLADVARIDLLAIDADITQDGDQSFHLAPALSGEAGQLCLACDAGADLTRVTGDVDGDGVADFMITIEGDHAGYVNFVL